MFVFQEGWEQRIWLFSFFAVQGKLQIIYLNGILRLKLDFNFGISKYT